MKETEKAFYLFYDWIDDLDSLDGADAWKIVKAISEYYRNGTNPLDRVDGTLRVVVSIIFHQILRKEKISQVRKTAASTNKRKPHADKLSNTERGKPLLPEKKSYGEFDNVYLTENELEKLKLQYGDRTDELIEKFSQKLKSKGYRYNDHYATIRLWTAQDACNQTDGKATANDKNAEIEEWFQLKLQAFDEKETEVKTNGK